MSRIPLCTLGLAALAALACADAPYPQKHVELGGAVAALGRPPAAPKLRFSVAAMQSPQDTLAAYSRLVERLGARLGVPVELVQRRTYQEVNDLLASGQLDAALVCTGGYIDLERRHPGTVEALAVPVVNGQSTYHSLLIVPRASPAEDLEDLRGKRFAFTDELSLSGYGYPSRRLARRGHDPASFFGQVIWTRNHDRSIEAVAKGLVDGAAVDSLIFAHVVRNSPAIAAAVRVVHRSPPFGIAPVVVSTQVPPERRAAIREALLQLDADPAAHAALGLVGFDRFAPVPPGLYEDAAALLGSHR